jgi:hypothetical protein
MLLCVPSPGLTFTAAKPPGAVSNACRSFRKPSRLNPPNSNIRVPSITAQWPEREVGVSPKNRVALTPGCQIGYMEHTG